MTLSYGFYNSVAEDRPYDATDFAKIFDGVILDGVFASIGESLMVAPSTGMNVIVGTGRAWFNHTWSYNDADVVLPIEAPDLLQPRYDTVVLEINAEEAVRANSFKIEKGTPGTNPVPKTLTNTATIHQYALGFVYVPVGVTAITGAHITNNVGAPSCPFVTGPLSMISTEDLIVQWQAEFQIWFDAMKDQLTTDAAGNLQSQINDIVGDVNPPLISLLLLKTHDHIGGDGNPITTDSLANQAVTTAKLAINAVDFTRVGERVPQFHHRLGGDISHWDVAGATQYFPGEVAMISGTVAWVNYSGNGFPVGYSENIFAGYPQIFLSTDKPYTTLRVVRFPPAGFIIYAYDHTGAASATGGNIYWFAIGPAAF